MGNVECNHFFASTRASPVMWVRSARHDAVGSAHRVQHWNGIQTFRRFSGDFFQVAGERGYRAPRYCTQGMGSFIVRSPHSTSPHGPWAFFLRETDTVPIPLRDCYGLWRCHRALKKNVNECRRSSEPCAFFTRTPEAPGVRPIGCPDVL